MSCPKNLYECSSHFKSVDLKYKMSNGYLATIRSLSCLLTRTVVATISMPSSCAPQMGRDLLISTVSTDFQVKDVFRNEHCFLRNKSFWGTFGLYSGALGVLCRF